MVKRVFLLTGLSAFAAIAPGQSTDSGSLEQYKRILETRRNSSLAHYRIGEIYFAQDNYQLAANEFREALSGDLEPGWVEVWAHINLGKIFDLTDQRERALNEYRQARRTKSFRAPGALARPGAEGPQPIEKTEPEYTDEARLAGLEGTVLVGGMIGEDGVLRNAAVTQGLGLGLDEKAMQAGQRWLFAPGMYQGRPKEMYATIPVDFFLPFKQSRWHLIGVTFATPEGASRATFASTEYPPGAGVVGGDAIEEGKLLGVVGRQATASVVVRVSEQGISGNIQVRDASDKVWVPQAAALISNWKFSPALKDGKPVAMTCALYLAWGPKNLTSQMVARLRDAANFASDDGGFGLVSGTIPVKDVAGKTVVFSGYVKTEEVRRGWVGIWWRVDGAMMPAQLEPDNSRDWQRYQLTIPVPFDAKKISFGAFCNGIGTAWFDGLSIQVDHVPYTPQVAADLDFETANLNGFDTEGAGFEMELDRQIFHTGKQSLRIGHLTH